MAQVDIGAETYDTFADLDFADPYIAADPINAATWAPLDDDAKGRFLVGATRILKREPWAAGIPSIDAPPQEVAEATAEFAAALAAGYDLGTAPESIMPVRRQKAGSVEIEYFRDFDNPLYRPPPLPKPVWDLIRPLLKAEGAALLSPSSATGVHGCSIPDSYLGGIGRWYGPGWYGFGPGNRDFN